MNNILLQLKTKGVIIPNPENVYINDDVNIEQIEKSVVLLPGTSLQGNIILRENTVIGPNAFLKNVVCSRNVHLASGVYENCVFLDGAKTRLGTEIRNDSLFMEMVETSHTVGCKMTILGIKVVLGSLVNYCDIFVSGGSNEPFAFTEIGSGAIHYNFTPNGLKFGSLIGPGAVGEMFGLFPKTFIGGNTQLVAPIKIDSQVLIPAGSSVRSSVKSGTLYSEENKQSTTSNFSLDLLTSVFKKVSHTSELIIHYKALALYFERVRILFAKLAKDPLLEQIFRQAIHIINNNIQERLYWLFSSNGLYSKLEKSLICHEESLKKSLPLEKVSFHLKEIAEQQSLLSIQDSLKEILNAPLQTIKEEKNFLALWTKHVSNFISTQDNINYFDCLCALSHEDKVQGKIWLESLISQEMEKISNLLQNALQNTPCSLNQKQYVSCMRQYFEIFRELHQNHKILFDNAWNTSHLGCICDSWNEYTDLQAVSWKIFHTNPIESLGKEKWEKLLTALQLWKTPLLIHWQYLLDMAKDSNIDESLIRRSAFCFHGTDGLRGPMGLFDKPATLCNAIHRWMTTHEITPIFFEALARNTIQAWQLYKGSKITHVIIGRDPRDIYVDDTQQRAIFYKAICNGALSTGIAVYDLGIVPIPCIPYTLAYDDYENSCKDTSLALYKSASHNPCSQDGLKVFIKQTKENGKTWYSKLPLDMELSIAALLYEEAIYNKKYCYSTEKYYNIQEQGIELLRNTMNDVANRPQFTNVDFLVMDLAHGAFSWGEHQKSIQQLIELCGINKSTFVGNAPTGKNINNNEGRNRVGAAHFENVSIITEEQIQYGEKFYGFPALSELLDYGKEHCTSLRSKGTAWAAFTDGDGDRSYVALYNPWNNSLHVFDGDESFYHQIQYAHYTNKIHKGDVFSFTVESSITFIQALYDFLEKYYPVKLILSDDEQLSSDKVNLKLCPVGDKHLLQWQAPGAESSGHILREYVITTNNGRTQNKVYTGNGPLAGLHTIKAISHDLQQDTQAWDYILAPYEMPFNTILYVYFVKKALWYNGSALWNKIASKIEQNCKGYTLEKIHFSQEPDTLYYIAKNEQNRLAFSVLARPSGTENKFGIKFYGSKNTQNFFQTISEILFSEIAPQLKDYSLQLCKDEQRILTILSQSNISVSLDTLKQQIFSGTPTASQNAYFMTIIEAISEKAQKLAYYDGTQLKILPRGKDFIKKLSQIETN